MQTPMQIIVPHTTVQHGLTGYSSGFFLGRSGR
jgi:hypothetical protein